MIYSVFGVLFYFFDFYIKKNDKLVGKLKVIYILKNIYKVNLLKI